jgi:hypothetical protein
MAPGFTVYLAKLAEMAGDLNKADDNLQNAAQIAVGDATVAANGLGILGEMSGFPAKYTAACQSAQQVFTQGAKALGAASAQLLVLKKHYEQNEASYAKKFGLMK